jgi:serine/threonine protein kinase
MRKCIVPNMLDLLFRWYRAPELLYGSRSYDEGVDLWYAADSFPLIIGFFIQGYRVYIW